MCECVRVFARVRVAIAVYLYFCQVFNQQSSDYSYFGTCVMNGCTANVCVFVCTRSLYGDLI